MAGVNKVLKPNEILFNIGDKADVMYIVRKGNMRVFFPKGNEEVVVATLKDGAIVGEMAFFDDKPRSASVKATDSTEVTVITRADFDKLLQQVPKWMVTMMQSLVGRLRSTNERLQALEASQAAAGGSGSAVPAKAVILPHQKHPFEHATRGLRIILLAQAKDGEKDGRDTVLQREMALSLWRELSGEDEDLFKKILGSLEKCKLIALRADSRKIPCIVFINRGILANFVEFFAKVSVSFKPLQPGFSPAALDMMNCLVEQVAASGYESLNVSLKSLLAAQKAKGVDTTEWLKALSELNSVPDLKITKSADDVTVKVLAKEHKLYLNYIRHIQVFHESGLA